MDQVTQLEQLSPEELYAIYQFLLLESRSPREIQRNARREEMIEVLSQTLTAEEAAYCIEFFEDYDFYEVPVLKSEMIDALPDDLLCALHSIYLDSVDFPETHEELVESLSQSNYFLKEDARKFYLWYHYFRERILWEDTEAAQASYQDATVRYDLEELGVADSFTMENYGDLLAEDAGLDAANIAATAERDSDFQMTEVHPSPASGSYQAHAEASQGHYDGTAPLTEPGLSPQADLKTEVMPEEPAPTPQRHEPELTPLQEQLLRSLEQEPQRSGGPVNQTIEINSFNLESYILEQEEAARVQKAQTAQAAEEPQSPPLQRPPSVSHVVDEIRTHRAQQRAASRSASPPPPNRPRGGPSVVVDPSLFQQEPREEPPKQTPPQPSQEDDSPRRTMILDASAIVIDEPYDTEPSRPSPRAQFAGARPAPPPPQPGRAQATHDDDSIDVLEPIEVDDDDDEEILEIDPIETGEYPKARPSANSQATRPHPPPPGRQPPPPKPPPKPAQKVPPTKSAVPPPVPRGAAAISQEHLEIITQTLYRTALLGATYARPQIRAIRIYVQKVLECSPTQLRKVRDILKRLQTEEHPLVPPPTEPLNALVPIVPYAARLQLVHSGIFLLGCKTLQNLERYRDFLIDMAVELRLDPADISLFDLFGIVEGEIQLGVKDCLELFGLEAGASEAKIRKAHRALVRRYHPDQFHSHGAEFVRLAERKMKESNMALEILLHRAEKNI